MLNINCNALNRKLIFRFPASSIAALPYCSNDSSLKMMRRKESFPSSLVKFSPRLMSINFQMMTETTRERNIKNQFSNQIHIFLTS